MMNNKKKVLVVGGGGREHAIIWKLSQSETIGKLYCAPGNAGTATLAENIDISAVDIRGMVSFARENKLDMVVVAPDDPLAMGMVDALLEAGIRAFGPAKSAAIIESSKAYAKNLMTNYGIPTADYKVFENIGPALTYIDSHKMPVVIKADGLALGKGVIIAQNSEEARKAVTAMMSDAAFGQAGRRVVIEEFLTGPELTVLAFADGKTVKPMISSRDHKRALDNDQGPNTGGMGAIAPGADLTEKELQWMQENIFQPTIDAMRNEGSPFKGVIYFGLMLTGDGPRVIEYNARFGDPEAQVVLPLLDTDLMEIMEAVIDERLADLDIKWKNQSACVVVMASGGYPGKYETGKAIEGLDILNTDKNRIVFHAGTRIGGPTGVLTAGGRVLGLTACADTMNKAIDEAYELVGKVSFENCHFRKDIGKTCSE